jgi:hypothetical protein
MQSMAAGVHPTISPAAVAEQLSTAFKQQQNQARSLVHPIRTRVFTHHRHVSSSTRGSNFNFLFDTPH